MQVIQLDFFEEKTKEDSLMEEMKLVKASCDKVRKGLFARHGELAKMYLDLSDRLSIIEKNICKG
jgi:hypothetical protein